MRITVIPITLMILMFTGCGAKSYWPKVFDNLPDDPNHIYARAMSESKNQQHALNTAREEGRVEIARQLESKIMAMFKRFIEETGGAADSELLQMTSDVSKSVVATTIYGCKPIKEEVKEEKGGVYRAYVLMKMPIGEANAALMAKIKEYERMYTRFRASKAFNELSEEVGKYEQYKREQGLR
ncbi:MAG: hypothetical protein ACE5PV_19660 [Candidatus Poribacteria bacterium]